MMSIIVEDDCGWLIDHEMWIKKHIDVSKGLPDLFQVNSPFLMESSFKATYDKKFATCSNIEGKEEDKHVLTSPYKRKVSFNAKNIGETEQLEFHSKIKDILESALKHLLALGIKQNAFRLNNKGFSALDNNKAGRRASLIKGPSISLSYLCTQYIESTTTLPSILNDLDTLKDKDIVNRLIKNEKPFPITIALSSDRYVMPANSSFLMSDITRCNPLLTDRKLFNLIILDPPWENKSANRKRKYNTLRNEELFELPVRELMDEKRCLVAVWVTNKQQQHRFVKEELFPFWGITYRATWIWLKITQHGETVLPLDGSANGKKPYECIILGSAGVCDSCLIPRQKVFVSVPCVVHSWKPPLNEVLQPFFDEHPSCLELFARNLLPGWTSWGNEVLLHQHVEFLDREMEQQKP